MQQMEPREPLEVQILRVRLRTLEELDDPAADALRAQLPAHLLFVPTPHGYVLVGRDGSPPAAGAEVDVDGRRLIVAKVGRSPLPDDRRRCAFLIA